MEIEETSSEERPIEISITKGLPIWFDKPAECEVLARACVLPNAWNILSQLANGSIKKTDIGYLNDPGAFDTLKAGWESLFSENPQANKDASQFEQELEKLDQDSGLIHLFAGLNALSKVWTKDVNENAMRAVLVVPETLGGDTEITAEEAVYVLQPGSLESFIGWKGAYAASKWLIALFIRRGRVPSQIAEDIIKVSGIDPPVQS